MKTDEMVTILEAIRPPRVSASVTRLDANPGDRCERS